jgi:hypothetical protein
MRPFSNEIACLIHQVPSGSPGLALHTTGVGPLTCHWVKKSTPSLPDDRRPNEIFCSSDSFKEHNWNPEAGDTFELDWQNVST